MTGMYARGERVVGYLWHDVLMHPICGLLWALGECGVPGADHLGNLVHDHTVAAALWADEWAPALQQGRPPVSEDQRDLALARRAMGEETVPLDDALG